MKLRRIRVSLQLAAVCLLLGAYGLAAETSYLYIVQGIPGRDISDTLNPVCRLMFCSTASPASPGN